VGRGKVLQVDLTFLMHQPLIQSRYTAPKDRIAFNSQVRQQGHRNAEECSKSKRLEKDHERLYLAASRAVTV
jgi:hypothetical protein